MNHDVTKPGVSGRQPKGRGLSARSGQGASGSGKKIALLGVVVLFVAVAAVCAYWFGASNANPKPADAAQQPEKPKKGSVKRRVPTSSPVSRPVQSKPKSATEKPVAPSAADDTSARPEISRSQLEGDVSEIANDIAAGLAAGNNQAVQELRPQLVLLKQPTLLRALQGLIRHGDEEQRKNALYAMALAFGEESRRWRSFPAVGGGESFGPDNADFGTISDGLPDSGTAEEQAAQQSHDIVSAVGEGLEDEAASVRQAAYEAMRKLGEEESGVLSQQLLSGEDSVLKKQLLSDAANASSEGAPSEQDLKTLIAGLENSDPAVHQQAVEYLKAVSGENLTTQAAAFDWLEKKVESDTAKAPGTVVGDGEAIIAPAK